MTLTQVNRLGEKNLFYGHAWGNISLYEKLNYQDFNVFAIASLEAHADRCFC
ncbi:MAG: hypothetical protein N2043_02635 [Ignavibacterium sp.]|nr:hypothetical protein [Ignavibacterium sp.]